MRHINFDCDLCHEEIGPIANVVFVKVETKEYHVCRDCHIDVDSFMRFRTNWVNDRGRSHLENNS